MISETYVDDGLRRHQVHLLNATAISGHDSSKPPQDSPRNP